MTRSNTRAAVIALAIATAFSVAGCSRNPATVISVWPTANSERTISPPPQPPRWPLTGLIAPNKAATSRRPLSVKVENLPAARPQTGLNSADVIYETVVEGGISRFNLVFQSTIPKVVGPIRSARLSDLWVVPQYHGVFFYSGSSSDVARRIRRDHLNRLNEGSGTSAYYRTARPAPHNLYLDMAKAWKDVHAHNFKTTANVPKLQFGPSSTLTSATAVRSVFIPMSTFNNVTWTYSKKRDVFLRENNRAVHRDAGSGKQVHAKNVVVMWAKYSIAGTDKHGGATYDIKLGGSGRATIFRNGHRYNGKWVATRTKPPHFIDRNGRPIRLAAGNTWFEVIALDVNISMK